MRLGLWGARADGGGLAAQTREFHRHLQPDRTHCVLLATGSRGQEDPSWYPGATTSGPDIDAETADRFLHGLDAVWCAETPYRPDFFDRARAAGVRSFLHANPELWKADHAPPDVVLAPTPWRLDLLPPEARILPWPVATDCLPFVRRTRARTFVHIAAPAMLDRNGTRLVLAAMRYVKRPIRLIVRGAAMRLRTRIGMVEVVIDRTDHADYWRAWPPNGDVLLLPRRYAGLSLPLQEAASLGMAVVSLDLDPQNAWLPPETLIPATSKRPHRMQGGMVDVHDGDARALARVVERLYDDDALVARCSSAAGGHAQVISWDALLPLYRETFSV